MSDLPSTLIQRLAGLPERMHGAPLESYHHEKLELFIERLMELHREQRAFRLQEKGLVSKPFPPELGAGIDWSFVTPGFLDDLLAQGMGWEQLGLTNKAYAANWGARNTRSLDMEAAEAQRADGVWLAAFVKEFSSRACGTEARRETENVQRSEEGALP